MDKLAELLGYQSGLNWDVCDFCHFCSAPLGFCLLWWIGGVLLLLIILLACIRRKKRCANCGEPLKSKAPVCANCGYDMRSGNVSSGILGETTDVFSDRHQAVYTPAQKHPAADTEPEAAPAPVAAPAAEPEAAPAPVATPAAEPVAAEPVAEPVAAASPVVEPVAEPVAEPNYLEEDVPAYTSQLFDEELPIYGSHQQSSNEYIYPDLAATIIPPQAAGDTQANADMGEPTFTMLGYKTCPSCGTPLLQQAMFCAKCGRRL